MADQERIYRYHVEQLGVGASSIVGITVRPKQLGMAINFISNGNSTGVLEVLGVSQVDVRGNTYYEPTAAANLGTGFVEASQGQTNRREFDWTSSKIFVGNRVDAGATLEIMRKYSK